MRGDGGRGRWRGGRGGSSGWEGGAATSHDHGRAALRELARRGLLEREEVKAMLRPGPLQDFRGSVLQVTSPGSFSRWPPTFVNPSSLIPSVLDRGRVMGG